MRNQGKEGNVYFVNDASSSVNMTINMFVLWWQLTAELEKVDEKLKLTESLLEAKVYILWIPFVVCAPLLIALWLTDIFQNLELKKTNDEKKAAMAAQFAAEATLRRVHAAQKDDDMPPIEAILAPLEAELKLSRQEVML